MDDRNKTGPQDAARVNVNEEHEVRYWTERFSVSKENLENAVKEVGVMAKDVEEFLKNRS